MQTKEQEIRERTQCSSLLSEQKKNISNITINIATNIARHHEYQYLLLV